MGKRKRPEDITPPRPYTAEQVQPSPKQRRVASDASLPTDASTGESDISTSLSPTPETRPPTSVYAVTYTFKDNSGMRSKPELSGLYTKVLDANKAAAKVVLRRLRLDEKKPWSDLVFFDTSSRTSRYLIPEDTIHLKRNVGIANMSGGGGMEYKVRLAREGLMTVRVEERKLNEESTASDDEHSDSDLPYLEAEEWVDWYSWGQ